MEADLKDVMRAVAKIAEVARIEADKRVAVRAILATYLSRQAPELLRDLVDYALGPTLLPHEARDLIKAATGWGRPGDAAPPHRAHAAGVVPVAQPAFAAQERPSDPSLGREFLVPKGAQEASFSGTSAWCPSAPKVLKQDLSSSYVEQVVTTSWADLAQGANPAPGSFQLVPHRGEAKRPAELDQDTPPVDAKRPTSPAETDNDAIAPVESNDELEPPPVELNEASDPACAETSDCAVADPASEARQLHFVSVQIWRNKDFVRKKQAEWTAKLRWMARFDPGVTNEIYVGFRPSPRKARETMRRHAAEGKVSAEWAEEFARLTADLPEATRVGPMTKRLYGAARKEGASSNAREGADHCWAAMVLNPSGSAPEHLMLDFGDGEPISFDTFNVPNGRAKNAPQWLALFDPDRLQAAKRDLATLRKHLAQGRQVEAHSPNTALAALIAHHVKPLADKITHLTFDNDRLQQAMAKRDREAAELESRVARLAADVLDLKRASGTMSHPDLPAF